MDVSIFIQQISSDDPRHRGLAAGVLGLVEEIRGLPKIQQAFRRETKAELREMLEWAGKRLAAAQKRGYDSFEDLLERFGVLREIDERIQHNMSRDEEALLRQIATQIGQDGLKMNMGSTMGRAMIGYAMGGFAGAALHALSDIRHIKDSSEGTNVVGETTTRAVPQAPTQSDFKNTLRELYQNPEPQARVAAMIELGRLRNPALLPHLVIPFRRDPSLEVRATIERVAKGLYLGTLYYNLSQRGVIEKEIEERIGAFRQQLLTEGGGSTGTAPTPRENQEASREEIAKILKQAEAKKRRKGR